MKKQKKPSLLLPCPSRGRIGLAPGANFGLLYLESAPSKTKLASGNSTRIMVRELGRQALLLAASDYLNLIVRDCNQGDLPAEDLPAEKRIQVTASDSMPNVIFQARVGTDGQKDAFWTATVDTRVPLDMAQAVVTCESQSRNEIVKGLNKAGFKGRPNLITADVQVPQETEALLDEMTDMAQFQALRELHALMKAKGESPWLLAALARAYANLGVLTEFHWSADHKAFKARALLYAQRLAVRYPDTPWSLWHRGYAEALVGLHKAALKDLESAAKAAQAEKNGGGPALAAPANHPGSVCSVPIANSTWPASRRLPIRATTNSAICLPFSWWKIPAIRILAWRPHAPCSRPIRSATASTTPSRAWEACAVST